VFQNYRIAAKTKTKVSFAVTNIVDTWIW